MYNVMDYGQPMKPFFIEILNLWAWADKFWGIWGIFGRFISTHFVTVSPLSMFFINQPLFFTNPQAFDTQIREQMSGTEIS